MTRDPNIMPLAEAAEIVGVHKNTIISWIRKGAVTLHRGPGRKRHVDVRECVPTRVNGVVAADQK